MRREKRERQSERIRERERDSERGRQTPCQKAQPKSSEGQLCRVPCTRFFSIKLSLQLPGQKTVRVHGFPRKKPCMNTFFVTVNQ